MNNQAEQVNASKATRALHEHILAKIARSPQQCAISAPQTHGTGLEVSGYISRIEKAAQSLEINSARVSELEEMVYAMKRQFAVLQSERTEANHRSAELEEQLAAEKRKVGRAEAVAASAVKRTSELDQALSTANVKIEALTTAIDEAFKDVTPRPGLRKAAA